MDFYEKMKTFHIHHECNAVNINMNYLLSKHVISHWNKNQLQVC